MVPRVGSENRVNKVTMERLGESKFEEVEYN
jgi:hypothetical protein